MTLRKSTISKCTVLVSLVLFFAAALTGCRGNDPGSDLAVYKEAPRVAIPIDVPVDLQGDWDSGFDSYSIDENTLTYNDGGWGMAYSGTVVDHHEFTINPGDDMPLGVLIIQYTYPAPEGASVGNYMPVYYAHRPGDTTFEVLDFGNAYDMEAPLNEYGLYPPVNENDLNTAFANATTGDYMDRYFVDGLWRGGQFAPYYWSAN